MNQNTTSKDPYANAAPNNAFSSKISTPGRQQSMEPEAPAIDPSLMSNMLANNKAIADLKKNQDTMKNELKEL